MAEVFVYLYQYSNDFGKIFPLQGQCRTDRLTDSRAFEYVCPNSLKLDYLRKGSRGKKIPHESLRVSSAAPLPGDGERVARPLPPLSPSRPGRVKASTPTRVSVLPPSHSSRCSRRIFTRCSSDTLINPLEIQSISSPGEFRRRLGSHAASP